uniref:Apple domain-containing protein n=1 Tax=Panagrolaimus sp. JU765 TaxID=591449 RepID=A0AC34R3T0_9BILA
MSRFLFSLLILDCVASLLNPPLNTFVALNGCFEYRKGYRIDVHEKHMTATDSIQFKDDCLKACLRTMIQDNFTCRSLMHMPRDDDCILTAMNSEDGAKLEKVDESGLMAVNFYENKCANGPFENPAAISEARFSSFKSVVGRVQIAQRPGQKPSIFAVIDGLRPNSLVDISIRRSPVNDCSKLRHSEIKLSQRLLQVFTDNSGFLVQPWSLADHRVLGDDFLGSTILLIDTLTLRIIDCATIAIKGDPEDFERIKSFSSTNTLSSSVIVIFTGFVVLLLKLE